MMPSQMAVPTRYSWMNVNTARSTVTTNPTASSQTNME